MSNPYQSPQYEPQQPAPSPGGYSGKVVPSQLVHQVRVVAVLNGVQGGLEIAMGLIYVVMAVVMCVVISMDEGFPNRNPPPGGPDPETLGWIILAFYGGMGAGGVIAGIVRLCVTFKNYNYRSRTFGIVSLGVGMLSMTTCYCIPTAIGMLIYGLIVYLNPSVMQAFEMVEEGESVEKVLYEFNAYRPPG